MKLDDVSPEFAKDLIELINSLGNMTKGASVSYGRTVFRYVTLDDLLGKIKQDKNFAFLQPLGLLDDGETPCIQCLLIHKSGEVLLSDKYPLRVSAGSKKQEEGAEITYSRRYSLSSFLGIACDDDTDANLEGTPSYKTPGQGEIKQVPQQAPSKNTGLDEVLKKRLNKELSDFCERSGRKMKDVVAKLEISIGVSTSNFTNNHAQRALTLIDEWQRAN